MTQETLDAIIWLVVFSGILLTMLPRSTKDD